MAADLLTDAMGKRAVVKAFEEELIVKAKIFEQRKDDAFGLALEPVRAKLLRDVDELIEKCNLTMKTA